MRFQDMVERVRPHPVPSMSEMPPAERAQRFPRNPISGSSIERIMARSVGFLALLFGSQAVPGAIAQYHDVQPVWAWAAQIAVFGGFLALAIAGALVRHFYAIAAFVAIAFIVAELTWPLAVKDPGAVLDGVPWLWSACSLALAAASVCFSTGVATVYLFVIPVAFAAIRVTPSGGGLFVGQAVLESVYVVVLGGAILVLVTIMRRAAMAVDASQASAISRYAAAVREHATEVQRVNVDAIVHDSVLTTFLSAGRAFSPEERSLASAMAKNALAQLASSAVDPSAGSRAGDLVPFRNRIARLSRELGVDARVSGRGLDQASIPADVAEALQAAAVQALVNSLQHAGPSTVDRWVTLTWADDALTVVIGDDGVGFDVSAMNSERLGVRVSIRERVANAGGEATITSAPGCGTQVTLRWPVAAG